MQENHSRITHLHFSQSVKELVVEKQLSVFTDENIAGMEQLITCFKLLQTVSQLEKSDLIYSLKDQCFYSIGFIDKSGSHGKLEVSKDEQGIKINLITKMEGNFNSYTAIVKDKELVYNNFKNSTEVVQLLPQVSFVDCSLQRPQELDSNLLLEEKLQKLRQNAFDEYERIVDYLHHFTVHFGEFVFEDHNILWRDRQTHTQPLEALPSASWNFLRLLLLCSEAMLSDVIFIKQPENGFSPTHLRLLAQAMKERLIDKQVFIHSFHPIFIEEFPLEHIFPFQENERTYQLERVTLEHSNWLKNFKLKEIKPQTQSNHYKQGDHISFYSLFHNYLDKACKIQLVDPYIQKLHNMRHLLELLNVVGKSRKSLNERTQFLLITKRYEQEAAKQQEYLSNIQEQCQLYSIEFEWRLDNSIHDRYILADNGWHISLGRGLDIFEYYNASNALSLEQINQRLRKSCEFHINYNLLNEEKRKELLNNFERQFGELID